MAGLPKIFIKATCGGRLAPDMVQMRSPRREELHPFAEMVSIYSAMPGETAVDNSGRREGCFLIRALDTVLRNSKWRLETLHNITTRMQRWIREKAHAEELAHIEHTQSKPIVLRKKNESSLQFSPGEMSRDLTNTKRAQRESENENREVILSFFAFNA